MSLVLSEARNAFIPGKLIIDNIMIAFEICHFREQKRQGKVGVAALKIDMSENIQSN